MSHTDFTHVVYIDTTTLRLWRALTEPGYISAYFEGTGPRSEWFTGAGVDWKFEPEGEYFSWGQRVLEADPNRRLAYTWHNYEPEMVKYFPDWTGEHLLELRKEPVSRVAFDFERDGSGCRLRLVHDGFAPDSEMLKSIRQGWPPILQNLKAVLENGD
ncbi:MAG TPA: SRPBCC domain-containing protein [Stackebrandtia sp.]|jgi:uncharacterized protein YndB with AHSA1/START domain|uniref:SRPBCC domain-containing protein n=1 Tax=Stackebrandtia sp. TaxID=2023065 RepID=UPI002D754193|nr:SRPBCC domain-containing protein [Stackebrandtia sp.]HZE37566.1 SRPBCC domain-containing protein [Stackebrandtia sp.]